MEEIIGHLKNINELKKIIINQSIGHAYLFYGIDGIGKFKIAQCFSKAILCESPIDGIACGVCASCSTFFNSSDFLIVEPINNSIKVDQIRAMIDEIVLLPTISQRKVIIIKDADLMNESAQNALLKVLEEPPTYATIILVASNKEKLIRTILSRVTEIDFSPLSDDEIKKIFSGEQIEDEILRLASGSAGKYQKLSSSDYIEDVLELENVLDNSNLLEINAVITKLKGDKTVKENIDDILDLLIIKLGYELKNNPQKTVKYLEIIEEVKNNIKRNANFDAQLDYLGIRIWETNK